jgi:hypothetical protein
VSPDLLKVIREEKAISDSTDAKLKEFCKGYVESFLATRV